MMILKKKERGGVLTRLGRYDTSPTLVLRTLTPSTADTFFHLGFGTMEKWRVNENR